MKKIVLAIVVVLFAVGGYFLYATFRTPALPSGPISAEPIGATPAPQPTLAATIAAANATPGAPGATPAPAATATPAGTAKKYLIDQAGSGVQFMIYEVLRGAPTNVVGKTNQVAGEIEVNLSDLATAQVGAIKIDARTLATDNPNRNRAMQNQILNTRQFEYITFTPTKITGLSGAATPGQTYPFQIEGNLEIKGTTKPAVFDAAVQLNPDQSLSGKATTKVKKSEFGLIVPNLPFLANVGDEVTLEIDYKALPAAG